MLDLLLEFLAADARWMRGDYYDGGERRCLMGALDYLQRINHINYAEAAYSLQQALPHGRAGSSTLTTASVGMSPSCARSSLKP